MGGEGGERVLRGWRERERVWRERVERVERVERKRAEDGAEAGVEADAEAAADLPQVLDRLVHDRRYADAGHVPTQ